MVLRIILVLISVAYNYGTQMIEKPEETIIHSLQGNWVLMQNREQKICIKRDSIIYISQNDKDVIYKIQLLKETSLLNIEEQPIKAKDGLFIWEEINPKDNAREWQYYLISYDDSSFVLMSTNSGQLLTYERIP